jgi:hypothetical protein
MLRTLLITLTTWFFAISCAHASNFSLSKAEEQENAQDQAQQEAQSAKVSALLLAPCRSKIKNQKIVVLIGESHDGRVQAAQSAFSPHFDAINRRLQGLGLKTYSQAQIRQQVAQAEIDAVFKNDPDAALSASKRLAAQYILKGLITTQASRNLAIKVNQVSMHMEFALNAANGKLIAQASADAASYAGQDTSGLALTLINEHADELVATLYNDYCRNTGVR